MNTKTMTFTEALGILRDALPTRSVKVSAEMWDHSHGGVGLRPASYIVWDSYEHFCAPSLGEAVYACLAHHNKEERVQDPSLAVQ